MDFVQINFQYCLMNANSVEWTFKLVFIFCFFYFSESASATQQPTTSTPSVEDTQTHGLLTEEEIQNIKKQVGLVITNFYGYAPPPAPTCPLIKAKSNLLWWINNYNSSTRRKLICIIIEYLSLYWYILEILKLI